MKIWHHGAWNRNFGDWVLFESIQHHLRKAARQELQFVPIDSQKTCYAPPLVDKMNRTADMLLIGGGGLIFHRPEDGSASGWQFNIRLEDIARIEIPIVVYGVGYNQFPYAPDSFPRVLNEHLRAVQRKAALFSVRDTGTRDELVRRGLDEERIRIVMDAGAFAPSHDLPVAALESEHPIIGVNIAGDRLEHRFPEPALENARRCYKILAHGLRKVVDRTGARVILIPHLVGIDESAAETLRAVIGLASFVNLREAAPFMYPPGPAYASFLVGAYARCDLAIGMRGHACIIPYGVGTPFLALGSHVKNRYLLDDIGMPERVLSTDAMGEGTLDEDEVAERIIECIEDSAATERMRRRHQEQLRPFAEWNRDTISVCA